MEAMGVSELVMNSKALTRVKGCGKTGGCGQSGGFGQTGQTFTLYHVNLFDGTGRPPSQSFHNLACGSCASTFQKMTYGIVLCQSCADQLGFPRLAKATGAATEAAKTSRR